MMTIRFRDNAPRRPPRVFILGPPGSGKTTTAEVISKRYGLVNVCPMELMKVEAKKNPQFHAHDDPENLLRVIDERINQSDCRVNGWVLDGFPQNEAQVNLISSMNVKPSLVVILE